MNLHSNLGVYVLFADDTNIFVEGATAKEAYEKGNELLKCLYKYINETNNETKNINLVHILQDETNCNKP